MKLLPFLIKIKVGKCCKIYHFHLAVYIQHIKSPITKIRKSKFIYFAIIFCIVPENASNLDQSKYSLEADGLVILEIEVDTQKRDLKKVINVMKNVPTYMYIFSNSI